MSMTIKVDAFEGPLDLLLHLIEKNKMSIYDIQIAPITNQYMAYIDDLKNSQEVSLESMSEFILMAATLLYIKSKMLLPKPEVEDPEDDPRGELVARLLEYKKMKHISEQLKEHEKDAENIYFRNMPIQLEEYSPTSIPIEDILGDVTMEQIYSIFADIVKRQNFVDRNPHVIDDLIVRRDDYTIKEKSRYILDLIEINGTLLFHEIFSKHTTKMEMIVTFMALLELVHKRKINIYQKGVLEEIRISGVDGDGTVGD
ncbi:MAG TPA: segregation/condensation protein A [Epulopiscium sp.]|nr:segregation/condensation protein A [Candidatus Epulonipiscium sp.]